MKKTTATLTAATIASYGLVALGSNTALAADCTTGDSIQAGVACAPDSQKTQTVPNAIKTTVNTLLFVVGITAVIVLVVGGLRYVLSGGDPKNTAAAKDTILYAVIGIVVALLAYAIVNFVLGQFGAA